MEQEIFYDIDGRRIEKGDYLVDPDSDTTLFKVNPLDGKSLIRNEDYANPIPLTQGSSKLYRLTQYSYYKRLYAAGLLVESDVGQGTMAGEDYFYGISDEAFFKASQLAKLSEMPKIEWAVVDGDNGEPCIAVWFVGSADDEKIFWSDEEDRKAIFDAFVHSFTEEGFVTLLSHFIFDKVRQLKV